MQNIGLVPEDFKQLPKDGARFEALVCQLLEAMGYRILEKPAIGPEGGRDLLVERTLKDAMVQKSERVVVQCKHHAHSRTAIGDNHVGVWRNAMTRYRARGYLLVTDSRVTENLSRSFREFTNDETNAPDWAAFWDVDQLISYLNQHSEIRDSFFTPESKVPTPLEDLASEVSTWLRAIRYHVTYIEQSQSDVKDILATFDEGSIRQQVLVRCVAGEITPAHVNDLDHLLDKQTPQGWLITDKRISRRARLQARGTVSVKIFNLSEFLSEMIWGKYFAALKELVEREGISRLYVDLQSYKLETDTDGREIHREHYESLDNYLDDWLIERGKMHMSLLGEFGAGKTWFCLHYASRQLQRFLTDPIKQRLPLLVTLRMFAKAMTAPQLINDALLEQYNLPLVGSAYEVFQQMNRQGKLLLILDGFDEMARQVNYQTIVNNFWELAKLVEESSKVVLTSRTEYFRWAKESEKILRGEEYGRKTIVLDPPRFEVLYFQPFSNDQIREVIIRRINNDNGSRIADRILSSVSLREMASKPVLIELLLAALDEVPSDILETPAQVYLFATNRLLLRNISAQKTFTSTADKLYFLCELAWEMVSGGELRIHYNIIPNRIVSYFGDRIRDKHELDHWDFDLRSQTLLHRDAAGYYEFAHKSLAEYFVAFKFASELNCLSRSFRETYCELNGEPCQIPLPPRDVSGLKETFGSMGFSDIRLRTVRSLLVGMLKPDASNLWKVIDETKGERPEEVSFVGGNTATLLLMKGETFENKNLAKSVLNGVNFNGKNLRGVDLRGATLQGTTLRSADLRRSNLTDVILDEASLLAADLRGAKGLEQRFFGYATYKFPRVENVKGRLSKFSFGYFRARKTSIVVIQGVTGAGKSTLLAWIAGQAEMPTFWHSGGETRVPPFGFDYGLYPQLATFLTISGYDSLANFLAEKNRRTAKKAFRRTNKHKRLQNEKDYDEPTLRKIGSLILPAFQRERLLICLDDVYITEGFLTVLNSFVSEDLSARIFITTQTVPPELKSEIGVIKLESLARRSRSDIRTT